ncbi:hypothetical protein SteCoe_5300 [Stentor coeruleus]|uniref:Uncharacterized protein n=1 Tax=Stentor coeruleus TaxID=5963 RepID=A0A1R2CSM9_9CILI|nr:hypothetical protein SteCoe_5300 [Stentor coeruleus]
MEQILSLFLKDKNDFFKDLLNGQTEINTLTIGLTFSCSHSESISATLLLTSLEKIMQKTQEESIRNLCLIKFFQILSAYLYSSTNYEPHLCDQFVFFSNFLPDRQFSSSSIEVVSHDFSQAYKNLFRIYAGTDYMLGLYKAVNKNQDLLQKKSGIFNRSIQESMEKIARTHDLEDFRGFLAALEGFFDIVIQYEKQETEDLLEYVAWKTKRNIKKIIDQGLGEWLSRVLYNYYTIFNENIRLELDTLVKWKGCDDKSLSENIRLDKIEEKKVLETDEKFVCDEKKNQMKEEKDLGKGKIGGIKIVQKPYTESDMGVYIKKGGNEEKKKVYDEERKNDGKKYQDFVDKKESFGGNYVKKNDASGEKLQKDDEGNKGNIENLAKDDIDNTWVGQGKNQIKIPLKLYTDDDFPQGNIVKKDKKEQSPKNNEENIKKQIRIIINTNKNVWDDKETLDFSEIENKFLDIKNESLNFARSLFFVIRTMIEEDDLSKYRPFWKSVMKVLDGFMIDHNVKTIKNLICDIPSVTKEEYKYNKPIRGRNQGRNRYRVLDRHGCNNQHAHENKLD